MDRVHIRIGLIQTDISVGNASSSSASLCGRDDKIICMFGHIYGMHGTVEAHEAVVLNISRWSLLTPLDPRKYLIRKYN